MSDDLEVQFKQLLTLSGAHITGLPRPMILMGIVEPFRLFHNRDASRLDEGTDRCLAEPLGANVSLLSERVFMSSQTVKGPPEANIAFMKIF
jgi:hypothetical protein